MWEVVVFVSNVLAFLLIGLQIQAILPRLDAAQWAEYIGFAGAICATVVVVRGGWVMGHTAASMWSIRHLGMRTRRPMILPTLQGGIVVSWCGMRGIVTIAAALALPEGNQPFPFRDLILFATFGVVLATLVVQGLTLRPLLRVLSLPGDDSVERETSLARRATAHAALELLAQEPASAAVSILRKEYIAREQRGGGEPDLTAAYPISSAAP